MNEYFNLSLPYLQIEQVMRFREFLPYFIDMTVKKVKIVSRLFFILLSLIIARINSYFWFPLTLRAPARMTYYRIRLCVQIGIRDSKFGQVLVVETLETSGAYVLGFRIDPAARLQATLQEILSLYTTQIRNPQLGIAYAGTTPSAIVSNAQILCRISFLR